ncbi:hypothetical protein PPERSA_04724 [Pseudocohnilembus persalinus]|uniref:Uncharacterized protein n=1 Tax=Pseudocohnilembus persalinus TaxID=266149 RepID=A0A0V0R4V0_PSEPJ|nr:hypothetical protein PPERSA_04724 [Pseudocohnilembus persalinus]|eukprot:KRX09418.1 hypothetical protein PPERSA_04724 [Pseudocohnilembus persalinus]
MKNSNSNFENTDNYEHKWSIILQGQGNYLEDAEKELKQGQEYDLTEFINGKNKSMDIIKYNNKQQNEHIQRNQINKNRDEYGSPQREKIFQVPGPTKNKTKLKKNKNNQNNSSQQNKVRNVPKTDLQIIEYKNYQVCRKNVWKTFFSLLHHYQEQNKIKIQQFLVKKFQQIDIDMYFTQFNRVKKIFVPNNKYIFEDFFKSDKLDKKYKLDDQHCNFKIILRLLSKKFVYENYFQSILFVSKSQNWKYYLQLRHVLIKSLHSYVQKLPEK